MKRSQRGWAEVIVGLLMVAAAWWFYLLVASAECNAKWQGSDLSSKFGVFSGCQVRTHDGRWLPEGSIRDTDTTRPPTSTPRNDEIPVSSLL